MGPRSAGLFIGLLAASGLFAIQLKDKCHRKRELTRASLESYENEALALQQRMHVVQRGFSILKSMPQPV